MPDDDSTPTEPSNYPHDSTSQSVPVPSLQDLAKSDPEPSGLAQPGLASVSQELTEAQTVIRKPAGAAAALISGSKQTPVSVAKVLLGQRLNHFRIDELIGGGGMGAVFRAHDEQLDRTVAIKVIPFVGDDPDLQRRFRNESQSAAKLDHQHIAKVFDTGRHGQWHYIVFEYVEGTNIRDWIQSKGVLTIDDAVLYTCRIADALGHAAQRGITHRDIKPSNILIAGEKQIKLVDMGLARSENLDLSEDMTASGVTLGTFDYISPEQAHDPRQADLRSDIYSLGCTLYFMLTGAPPYPGGTMLQKLLNHGNQPAPDPRTLRSDVSENLVAVINKMLAKKPSQRYQNVNHLIADLREVAVRDNLVGAQAIGPVELTSAGPLMETLEKHLPWVMAAALMVSVALWLRLESAASRQTISVPVSAKTPIRIDGGSGRSMTPTTESSSPSSETTSDSDPPITKIPLPQNLLEPASRMETTKPLESAGVLSSTVGELKSDSKPGPTSRPLRADLAAWERAQPILDQDGRSLKNQAIGSRLLGSPSFQPSAIRIVAAPTQDGVRLGADQELYCASLARGIELAMQYEIGVVEIASPKIFSPPLRVDAEMMRIQSSVGQSVIVFKTGDAVTQQRPSMCTLGSGVIEFKNIHFVWDVPEDKVDGGAMFQAKAGTELWLSNCTVTINNAAERSEVYAVDIITDQFSQSSYSQDAYSQSSLSPGFGAATGSNQGTRQGQSQPSGQPGRRGQDGFPMVAVDLDNVIVRGQASMIHMDYAARLLLRWNNGLLAVSGRMVDTAGARVPLEPTAAPMILSLTRVTAHASSGIARVRLGSSGSYPFVINRNARNCVFIIDDSQPHFDFVNYPVASGAIASGLERTGFDGIEDMITADTSNRPYADDRSLGPLRLGGSSNAYLVDPMRSDPLLRMTMSNGELKVSEVSALAATDLAWVDEVMPRWTVQWQAGNLPMMSMSSRRPEDYRQSQSPSPGFEEDSLPPLPVITEF